MRPEIFSREGVTKKKLMIDSNHLHRLTVGDKNLTLIGTAHVSRSSVELVREVIEGEQPDTVAVELCEARYRSITDRDAEEAQTLASLFQHREGMSGLVQRGLAFVQRKIGRKLNIKPGQEMLQAIQSAQRVGARIYLADRDVGITLSRVWTGMGLPAKIRLLLQLLAALAEIDRLRQEDVEAMKNEDALERSLAQINRSYPEIGRIVIDERDQYLAYKLKTAPGHSVVAVVGAGHVPGIRRYLQWESGELAARLGEPLGRSANNLPLHFEDALSNT